MRTQTHQSFGIAELVNALQDRMQSDQKLLTQVMSYWASERPEQSLSDLEDWTPIEAVEQKSNGKLKPTQVRWYARNREENGTDEAFMKVGRGLLVNIPLLFRILATQQKGSRG